MSKTHTIRIHEHGRRNESYGLRYTADEVYELYSDKERKLLANGQVVIPRPNRFGHQPTIVDLEAFFKKTLRALSFSKVERLRALASAKKSPRRSRK